jgi:hypothetical protein
MANAKSFLESNKAKKATTKKSKEEMDALLEAKEKYEKFRRLCDTQDWKDCRDFIKDEIYQGLSLAPGDVGTGDWWLKYCWGLKACIERIESHAKKYDEAIKELSK